MILHKALTEGEKLVRSGETDAKAVIQLISDRIRTEPLARIDYVNIVSFPQIQPVDKIEGDILAAVAVYFGTTRLIDNFIVNE